KHTSDTAGVTQQVRTPTPDTLRKKQYTPDTAGVQQNVTPGLSMPPLRKEKDWHHLAVARHAESRRYLLPGEDYAKDALEIARHNPTPQAERPQPQLQAQNWSPHEQRIRAGLYEPEPRQASSRRRQFIKVGEVWVPTESLEQAEAQHIQAAPDVKARHEALEQPQTLPYAQQGRLYWTHFSE